MVDVSDGGADYFTVPLSNIWGTTLDIVDRTGSLNKAQSVPNEDGTYTYVISPTDPGVQTGSTPTDSTKASSRCAWPSSAATDPTDLGARGRVVKLDDLDTEVPALRRVSAGGAGGPACRSSRGVPAPSTRRDELTWAAGWSPDARPASGAKSPVPHWKQGTRWW